MTQAGSGSTPGLIHARVLRIAGPIVLSNATLPRWGRQFGGMTLAANQVLMQFLKGAACVLDGFAFAAEALTGQPVNARSRGARRRGAPG